MTVLTRRRLLSITANVVTVGAIAGPSLPGIVFAADEQPQDGPDQGSLATLAHDLFPHDAIPFEVYMETAGTIIAQEQGSTGDLEQITAGLQQLNRMAGDREWYKLGEQTRIQALKKMESSPFFNSIMVRIRGLLYLRPEVWQLVGYGGNAMAHGGYLTHGFNDIDWLG